MADLQNHSIVKQNADSSDDEDSLIASLEESDSPALNAFREQRVQQLHDEFTRVMSKKNQGFGNYTTISEEKLLMDLITSVKYTVVHFAKDDFARCLVMDSHLSSLASRHLDTRLLKIEVEKAPFLVTKLNVKVLPCVIAFVDGVSVDRILGFEGLGYTADNFTTIDLELRLLQSGVLQKASTEVYSKQLQRMNGSNVGDEDEDRDDDDWD